MLYEMKRLLKITGNGALFLFLLLLRCPFDAAMTCIQATFFQNALGAIAQTDSNQLKWVCIAYGLATLGLFLYNGTIWSIYAPFVVRMEGKLRRLLFRKIASLPYERLDALPQGEWVTRLNVDVQMPFSRPLHLPHAACAIVNICVSACILWRMNSAVFGWVMLFVIPHIAISQLLIARAMPGLNKKSLEATAKNTDDLTAFIDCADVAKLYDAQGFLLERFERSSMQLLQANMRTCRRKALGDAILPLFGLSGYLVLLMVSSGWIASGSFTFGDLTAAFQYRGGILVGCMMLINSLVSIQASMAGIRRLNEPMAEETEEAYG